MSATYDLSICPVSYIADSSGHMANSPGANGPVVVFQLPEKCAVKLCGILPWMGSKGPISTQVQVLGTTFILEERRALKGKPGV